jgi:hypothetical protein
MNCQHAASGDGMLSTCVSSLTTAACAH